MLQLNLLSVDGRYTGGSLCRCFLRCTCRCSFRYLHIGVALCVDSLCWILGTFAADSLLDETSFLRFPERRRKALALSNIAKQNEHTGRWRGMFGSDLCIPTWNADDVQPAGAQGPPYPPQHQGLGEVPTVLPDGPINAVFLALFVFAAVSHMTLFQINMHKRGKKFVFNAAIFGIPVFSRSYTHQS